MGLPELTNKDGAPCLFSCPSQAWSSATILSLQFELEKLKNGNIQKNNKKE